ncbi:MAG TPA: 6-hydroxymethylpterin diphosphokinase MptE-like protein [Tepidisphaeraceae bacterium]|jgi:hypothetical protein|nr:6-hydroxymethylpterin diphosphokinase MptE-like protein [Tepidisphaeraceae bacterium]
MTASNDRSLRFVLPPEAPYVRNLSALWASDSVLAARIEALGDEAELKIEPSKAGPPTLAITTCDHRTVYLHSRYDPATEATKLIDTLDLDGKVAFYIHGFGLGYHVEQAFDRASPETMFCIFEPDLRVLRAAMSHRDLSRIIESHRLMFFTNLDKAELFTRLTPQMAVIALGFGSIAHAPSLQLHSEFHRQMQTWVAEFVAYCRTTVSTLIANGRRTAENVSRNLPWYVATPSLSRLSDSYRGKPAVIVSAGPSLRKNKHLLRELDGRAVIIAVQTTFQPLLELGIEPHFVTSLDYHDICTRFFEKLSAGLKTELVAEPKATSAIFDLNPGPLSLLGNDFAERLLEEMKLNKTRLPAGATVAHLSYYLAEHLGCDPIIFIGQDLGFSDGLCYSPGTSYEDVWRPELSRFCTVEMKQWEQIVRDRNILRKTTDYQGRPTYTEERLFTYLQQFERDFAKSNRRIIDATEGGVLKRGAQVMTFAEAIKQFCSGDPVSAPPVHSGLSWQRLDEAIACIRKRKNEAEQIEHISRETLPLLEEIRDSIEDQVRVNRAIGKLDALRARIASFNNGYELIMQLTQLTELQRFHADRKIGAAKLDANEKQRRQVARDIANVEGVIGAAAQFQSLMSEVIDNLLEFKSRDLRKAAA